MNAAVAKLTIKQHLQNITDEQLQSYHLTHDYFTGRPLAKPIKPRAYVESVEVQKKRRDLSRMNEVLYPTPTLGDVLGDALANLKHSSDVSQTAKIVPLEKPSEDLVNRAKSWFAQYQAEGLESLLPAQSASLTEANLEVIKRVFSYNTVLTKTFVR